MKKYSIILAALLTLCGVQAKAESVSLPSSTIQAGETIVLPINFTNDSISFVGFQMDLVLPEGISPVSNEWGTAAITKTARLNASHTFSTIFNTRTRTLRMVCTSMNGAAIEKGMEHLFFIDLKADDNSLSGTYSIVLNNVKFTTNSAAVGGAKGYSLEPATGIINILGNSTEPIIQKDTVYIAKYDTIYQDVVKYDTIYQDVVKYDTIYQDVVKYDTIYQDVVKYDTIYVSDMQRVEAPVIMVNDSGQVSISCLQADAIIYYTTDGTEPTEASTRYQLPFKVQFGSTIKAIAVMHSTITVEQTTGIRAASSNVASARYFSVSGKRVSETAKGSKIKVITLSDGSQRVIKTAR